MSVMSRRTLGRRLVDFYAEKLSCLRSALAVAELVATTADVCSESTRSFRGITVHWIDNNLKRRSADLACRRFSGAHTHDRVVKLVNEIHQSFDLTTEKSPRQQLITEVISSKHSRSSESLRTTLSSEAMKTSTELQKGTKDRISVRNHGKAAGG